MVDRIGAIPPGWPGIGGELESLRDRISRAALEQEEAMVREAAEREGLTL